MTDTSPTQTPNTQGQNSKKNFFGGEVNFQDKSTFEALDSSAEENAQHPESTGNEIILEPTSTSQATEEPNFVDFDPFGDDEDSEMVIEPTIAEQTEHQKTETPQQQEDFSLDEMASSLKDEITQQQEKEENKNKEEETTSEEEIFEQEPESTGNEIIDKFLELSSTARKIFQLSEDTSHFKILGGKSPKSTLEYFIYLVEDEDNHSDLFIKKVETNNEDSDEEEHLLQWSYNKDQHSLDIFVDEVILYELKQQATEEENKKNQIMEKLNKFWFLFETYFQDLYKEYQEKKEAQEKKKQLHEIFRSF